MKKDRKGFWGLILLVVLALTACGAGGEKPSPEQEIDPNKETLVYANLSPAGRRSSVDREAIDEFNRTHTDVQIEVRDYFDEDGYSGTSRLMVEIMTGNGPDLIDLGYGNFIPGGTNGTILPYRQLARKGCLEDLWPYIENDPELGRDALLEAPLKAAEVDGGLYLAFDSVSVETLIGAEKIVGDRTSWTLADLREAFASMPENSSILMCYFDKEEIASYIFGMSLDGYVDWEKGECNFDNEEFRSGLEFINSFPSEFDWPASGDVTEQVNEQIASGRQMLTQDWLGSPIAIQMFDNLFNDVFGSRASFVGYPVSDGSVGSSFEIRTQRVAMSSGCRNKEAAWDFLRQMFLPQYNAATLPSLVEEPTGIPINLSDYELVQKRNRNFNGRVAEYHGGKSYEYHSATMEDCQRFDDLINSIDKINLCDQTLYTIVLEACGPYFAGDKTLDETVDQIQRRVTLYVNENR